MKIDSAPPSVALPSAREGAAAPRPGPKTGGDTASEVTLSPQAVRLQHADGPPPVSAGIDRARIDGIKQAIVNGDYVIRTGNIADSLIVSVKEMLNGRA